MPQTCDKSSQISCRLWGVYWNFCLDFVSVLYELCAENRIYNSSPLCSVSCSFRPEKIACKGGEESVFEVQVFRIEGDFQCQSLILGRFLILALGFEVLSTRCLVL